MPIQGLSLSIFNKKKISNPIIGGLLVIIVVILFTQALNMNIKQDKLITEQPGLIGFLGTISVIVILLLVALNFIASYYRSKYEKKNTETIYQPDKVKLLQSIRNKVIIGLKNTRKNTNPELQEEMIIFRNLSPETIIDYFSSEIRRELQTGIKGKTAFILIEIAYQDPSKTNPTQLSKNLNIPLSSVSREIKKLISLDYVETYISNIVLEDTRLRNFKITTKGFTFLSNLNNALNITIDRLEKREVEKSKSSENHLKHLKY
ncbi:MAG: hypothetical protein ACFFB5_20465 [Promethearchaeota archaeon]